MRVHILAAITLAACTASQEPQTSVEASEILGIPQTCGCNGVTPTTWSSNITQYWVFNSNNVGVNNMTVMLTPSDPNGSDAAYFYAYGIANSYTVGWLYRVPKTSYTDFVAAVVGSFSTKSQPGSSRFWGIQGGIGGGPIGPSPGGGDPVVIERVQRSASTIVDAEKATFNFDPAVPEK